MKIVIKDKMYFLKIGKMLAIIENQACAHKYIELKDTNKFIGGYEIKIPIKNSASAHISFNHGLCTYS